MHSGKKLFIAGALAATTFVSGFSNIQGLLAAKHFNNAPEISFARDLGLFDTYEYSNATLSKNISKLSFYRSLNKVLFDLHLVANIDLNEMQHAGLMGPKKLFRSVSRKEAFEGVFRTILFLWDKKVILEPKNINKSLKFKDYKVEPKYEKALNYAIEVGIINGNSGGRLNPKGLLNLRDSLYLLHRLHSILDSKVGYEAPKSVPTAPPTLRFTDIPMDHWFTDPIKELESLGAFDLTDLGKKLEGQKGITTGSFSKIMLGILEKHKKAAFISEVKLMTRRLGTRHALRRKDLARFAAIFVQAFPHTEHFEYGLYSDVRKGSNTWQSLELLNRAGIRLGYPDGRLAGNERVARYEALGLINKTLKKLDTIKETPKPPRVQRTATKEDINNFKNLIEAKKLKIRKLLNRRR